MGGDPSQLFEVRPFGLVGKAVAHNDAKLLSELLAEVVPPSSQLVHGLKREYLNLNFLKKKIFLPTRI
jgi:hypothetical protein